MLTHRLPKLMSSQNAKYHKLEQRVFPNAVIEWLNDHVSSNQSVLQPPFQEQILSTSLPHYYSRPRQFRKDIQRRHSCKHRSSIEDNMPPRPQDPSMADTGRPIPRVLSTTSLGSTGSLGSDADTPRNAAEYRVRKSKLIG